MKDELYAVSNFKKKVVCHNMVDILYTYNLIVDTFYN